MYFLLVYQTSIKAVMISVALSEPCGDKKKKKKYLSCQIQGGLTQLFLSSKADELHLLQSAFSRGVFALFSSKISSAKGKRSYIYITRGYDESHKGSSFPLHSVARVLEIDMKTWELKNCTIVHIIQLQNTKLQPIPSLRSALNSPYTQVHLSVDWKDRGPQLLRRHKDFIIISMAPCKVLDKNKKK